MFQFNESFTAQLFRVKINTIQLKETTEENKKTNDQVMQDRQYQVIFRLTRSFAMLFSHLLYFCDEFLKFLV